MKKVWFLVLLLVVVLATAASAYGLTLLQEDFESGQNGWIAVNGSYTAAAAPTPHGQSFDMADGATTRIAKAFTPGTATTITISYNFYDMFGNSNTSRTYGGFAQNAASPVVNGALARIGKNNLATYQFQYYTTGLQSVNTAVALSAGWHSVTLTMDTVAKTIAWQLDAQSGTVTNANIALPNAVVLGNNYSNGAAGAPDTSVFYDDVVVTTPVQVTPEPSSLLALGTGLLGLVGVVRKRHA